MISPPGLFDIDLDAFAVLHVLHLDCKDVAADQIVVTSRLHTAESFARLLHKTASGDLRANDTQNPTAAQAAERRAMTGPVR